MIKFRLFIALITLFLSCKNKEIVPERIIQFSEEAIEKSIKTYPLEDFYNNSNFGHNVSQEYLDKLNSRAIIWRGMEHTIELREANLINQYKKNSEYLLKYWVTFKERKERKFSYLINLFEKEGKIALKRFEPINANIASTFYSPNSKFDIPNFDSNRTKIYFTYISIFATLLIIIFLVVLKRKYLLLLTAIPLLFIYKQGMTIYNYQGIHILSPKTYFGLPMFKNIDLHFTHISLTVTGVFCAWTIIGIFLIGTFLIKKNNLHNNTFDLAKTKPNKTFN